MARGKLIPKEILFPVINRLEDIATWQNIYDNTIGETGKRYASNDIGYSLEYYLENNMVKEKQMNKKTRVFSLGKSVNDTYDDFLKNVSNQKITTLEQLVEVLDHKQIFTKDGGFVVKNHEDFTKFMMALEDICKFYTNLLHTRENADLDGDSMTGLTDNAVHDIFNSNITYIIRSTKNCIEECCRKLKYGKEQEERIKINGMLDNVTWFLKV